MDAERQKTAEELMTEYLRRGYSVSTIAGIVGVPYRRVYQFQKQLEREQVNLPRAERMRVLAEQGEPPLRIAEIVGMAEQQTIDWWRNWRRLKDQADAKNS